MKLLSRGLFSILFITSLFSQTDPCTAFPDTTLYLELSATQDDAVDGVEYNLLYKTSLFRMNP